MTGPINSHTGLTRHDSSGNLAGYAVIAAALCLSLLATIPLATTAIGRILGAVTMLLGG